MSTETEPQSPFWESIVTIGKHILGGMEYVGEIVVSVFGLDDSKFQDVMDGMTEEDWEYARQVEKERKLDDAILEAMEALARQKTGVAAEDDVSLECLTAEEKALIRSQVTDQFLVTEMSSNSNLPEEQAIVRDEECGDVALQDGAVCLQDINPKEGNVY
mmetsp:Transcript_14551/g.21922  ORF Transcript_14551/g.21922 Transcript_14551/m.21922 type:complete len:160 (+) Transcript_14551:160-639(+)|eukprot:CAMPEP_0185028478 /NCGR_PEP_ID=MMETSP1103-20130426/14219_1 /TAXON_ID=36769 /ORGANISM="Paraphysomonas bandaiensis, Strain Caron Lab Isolate" /LENGTH=159 /DNA_ID=CAMNT_0027562905 /DNA_START=112 /DNA_END=591 /DNA_ORIENTATION=-